MILVPIDVGVRRVALTRGDFARARGWVARRVGLARPTPEVVPGLAELRAARGTEPATSRPRGATEGGGGRTPPAEAAAPAATSTPGPRRHLAPLPEETLAERLARQRRGS